MNEQWVPVSGYEGLYEAHTSGVVRSLDRVIRVPSISGFHDRRVRGRVMAASLNKTIGYRMLALCKDGVATQRYLHHVIYESFKGPVPANLEINHKDGCKTNNRIDNLEVVTRSRNVIHAIEHGLIAIGEDSTSAKLTETRVVSVRRRIQAGETQRVIAADEGVTFQNINCIKMAKTWKRLGGPVEPDLFHTGYMSQRRAIQILYTLAAEVVAGAEPTKQKAFEAAIAKLRGVLSGW